MKAFIGLLQKERIRYLNVGIIGLIVSLFAVSLGPIIIHRYNYGYDVDNSRLLIVIAVVAFTTLFSLFYFIASIRRDVKQKELWLHNQQSIYKLIFAKFLYQGIQMIVICAVAFLGFFFVGDEITGTFSQKLFFYGVCVYFVVCVYMIFGLIAFIIHTIDLQLKQFIKKGSVFLTFFVIIAIIKLFDSLPDPFLPYWKISSKWLQQFQPKLENGTSLMFFDIYLAEELFTIGISIVLYMVTCKWFERVMMR